MDRIAEFEAIIKSQGLNAPKRIITLATSASAGNAAAKTEIEGIFKFQIKNMLDYWQIIQAASNLMSRIEIKNMESETLQALNAGHSAMHDADAYLANKLGNVRRSAGMTQSQLSQASGVNLTTLQKLENGTNRILGARTEITLKLAKALGVTVEDLVSID